MELRAKLTQIKEVWGFPLRTSRRKMDMLAGGALFLCVPIIGWILNLGHRWRVMERLYVNDPPWFRGFRPIPGTLVRGLGVGAMGVAYLGPGLTFVVLAATALHGAPRALLQAFEVTLMLLAFHAFPMRWRDSPRHAILAGCSGMYTRIVLRGDMALRT